MNANMWRYVPTKDDIQSEFWNTSKKHYLELYKKSSHLHIKNHDLI